MPVVNAKSGQVCLTHLRQCCAPCSFSKSNDSRNTTTHQLLSVVGRNDCRNIPLSLRNKSLRGTDSRFQVANVALHQPCSEVNISVPTLRERNVQDCIECMLTNSNEHIGNTSLGSLCFMRHVDDATSGECDCSGTHNACVARRQLVADSNDLIELSNFKSFSE